MSVTLRGGKKLEQIATKARRERAVSYDVGFFPKAKYADGTYVAMVGLWQEFGTRTASGAVKIPERPYFRQANRTAQRIIRKHLLRLQDRESKTLSRNDAGKIAAVHAGIIQESITTLRQPPLAQSTIDGKGSSNPLIDTGLLRQSVSWEVLSLGS